MLWGPFYPHLERTVRQARKLGKRGGVCVARLKSSDKRAGKGDKGKLGGVWPRDSDGAAGNLP